MFLHVCSQGHPSSSYIAIEDSTGASDMDSSQDSAVSPNEDILTQEPEMLEAVLNVLVSHLGSGSMKQMGWLSTLAADLNLVFDVPVSENGMQGVVVLDEMVMVIVPPPPLHLRKNLSNTWNLPTLTHSLPQYTYPTPPS